MIFITPSPINTTRRIIFEIIIERMIILKTKGNKNNGAKNNTMNDSNIQMLFEFNADAYEKVKNKKN